MSNGMRLIVELRDISPLDPVMRDSLLAVLDAPHGGRLVLDFAGGSVTLEVSSVEVAEQ
jgi:hypothetical protein